MEKEIVREVAQIDKHYWRNSADHKAQISLYNVHFAYRTDGALRPADFLR